MSRILIDRLFVYGTLMHGYPHPMAEMLARRARYVGPATFRGQLYLVTHYPGLIASSNEEDIVHGDVFADCHDALIAELDDYEGCGKGDPHPQQYRREIVRVRLTSGEVIDAWTYIYNLRVDALMRIESGRFTAPA